MIYGLDLSLYNSTADYTLDGVSFVFARSSYGATSDTSAEKHLARARAKGCVLGIYHYLYTGADASDPEEQAAFFITRAANLAGPLMLAVDVEPLDPKHPDPAPRVADFAYRFWRSARARAGRPVAVYGGDYLATLHLHVDMAADPYWRADYTPPYPTVSPWREWTVLQYGVKKVDLDLFPGSRAELCAAFGIGELAHYPESATPPAPCRLLKLTAPMMRGGDVVALQLLLDEHGLPLLRDGIYGPTTAEAVRRAQGELGIAVDGIVGPDTWRGLRGR